MKKSPEEEEDPVMEGRGVAVLGCDCSFVDRTEENMEKILF